MGEPVEQDLCRNCRMCCDGTLFYSVDLKAEELESAKVHFEIITLTEKSVFRQPCPYITSHCTIYQNRPTTCRTYACRTLEALRSGEISSAEALERVRAARTTVADIEAKSGKSLSLLRETKLAGDAIPADLAQAVLAMGVLQLQLDRHFRWPNQLVMIAKPTTQ